MSTLRDGAHRCGIGRAIGGGQEQQENEQGKWWHVGLFNVACRDFLQALKAGLRWWLPLAFVDSSGHGHTAMHQHCFLGCFLIFNSIATLGAEPLAFPGAEGYGRHARGGRGGDVVYVTNLNDSGKGSLRQAIEGKDPKRPRTVLFKVAGNIVLKKPLRLETISALTIAGQSAPGQGIALRDHGLELRNCSDIVLRHLHLRLGDVTKTSEDVIALGSESGPCRRIIFDHLTATWGIDGIMDTDNLSEFTMQWCLFGEALNNSTHYKKQPHAMLMSFRRTQGNISIHHNLLLSSRDRHPTLGGGDPKRSNPKAVFDFRNNVIYNWEGACNLASGQFNLVANGWYPGPNTDFKRDPHAIAPKAEAHGVTTGFMQNNVFEGKPQWTADNLSAVQWGVRGGKYIGKVERSAFAGSSELVPVADRPLTQSPAQAYELVLAKAGASLRRDAADERIIAGVRRRSHRRIDSQDEVGGWPELQGARAPEDGDGDGMADDWERAQGLDPANAADGNGLDAQGYTHLERYLDTLTKAQG